MLYSLFLFRLLQGYSVRWLAIQEPICGRLNEIIPSQSPVLIYHRWCDEILPCYQVIDRCARVLQYHLDIALVAYLCELIQHFVEIGSFMQSLYCVYASFRHTHLSLVHTAKCKIHLLRTLKVDARKESQNKVIILPPPYGIKHTRLALVGTLYLRKEVYLMVGFSEVVLDVVVFRLVAQLLELVFESP